MSYSREFDEVQARLVGKLSSILRSSLNKLNIAGAVCLPTGDGVFVVLPGQTSVAALEVARAVHDEIRAHLHDIPLRIGIHEGAVALLADINGRTNAVGAAVNTAQRVMDVGDAGHILMSEAAARTVEASEEHGQCLTPISDHPIEVKHGVKHWIFSYVDGRFGSTALPSKVEGDIGVRSGSIGRNRGWRELIDADRALKLIDYSMPIMGTPELLDALESLLARGGLVQILILNPLSATCEVRRVSSAYDSLSELETTIEYVLKILFGFRDRVLSHLGADAAKRLDVRLFDALPGVSAWLTDKQGHVSFYIEHLSGARGPFFTLARPSALYTCVEQVFDIIWQERAISIYSDTLQDDLRNHLSKRAGNLQGLRIPAYLEKSGGM